MTDGDYELWHPGTVSNRALMGIAMHCEHAPPCCYQPCNPLAACFVIREYPANHGFWSRNRLAAAAARLWQAVRSDPDRPALMQSIPARALAGMQASRGEP